MLLQAVAVYHELAEYPPLKHVNAELINAVHQNADVKLYSITPSLLVDIAEDPQAWKTAKLLMSSMPAVCCQRLLDRIPTRTHIHNFIGSTECG